MFKSVAVAILLLMAIPTGSVAAAPRKNLDEFAKCLTAKKASFYGIYFCQHCADQRELFGSSMKYVTYVECGMKGSAIPVFACRSAVILTYPTWVFADGSRMNGLISLEELSKKTGCPLP